MDGVSGAAVIDFSLRALMKRPSSGSIEGSVSSGRGNEHRLPRDIFDNVITAHIRRIRIRCALAASSKQGFCRVSWRDKSVISLVRKRWTPGAKPHAHFKGYGQQVRPFVTLRGEEVQSV